MPAVSIDLNMVRVTNDDFVKKAEACAPELIKTVVRPVSIVDIVKTEEVFPQVSKKDDIENLSTYHMAKGDKICLDFGDHQVGYVTLKLNSVGSPQDAPAFFRLKFGEIAKEMTEDSADYDGWISRGWIQEEFIHIDVLPAELKLPRRYAFRYMEIEAIDTSLKWQMVVEDVYCTSVSSVRMEDVKPVESDDEMIRKLDKVSLRTLHNCMQSVFEDGPKRDRRLWLGDLRLQALANYETFHNMDLVKRCLYLFAGQTKDNGQVSACLFTEPKFIVDDTFLLDYSMFFGATLLDYYEASGDRETLEDLSKCAYRQMEIAGEQFDARHLMKNGEGFWGFIDWTEGLNKQTAMQGVYIYCAKKVQKIAEILGDTAKAEELAKEGYVKESIDKYLGLFKGVEEAGNGIDGICYIAKTLEGFLEEDVEKNLLEIINSVNAAKQADFKLVFDPTLVRGMSYYTGTIFEIAMPELGAACGGGGRYDKMVGKFTGQDVPACGFSIGFERIVLLLMESGFTVPMQRPKVAYLIEKGYPADKLVDVIAKAQEERQAGKQVLVVRMNKNKKFQKEKLAAEGYKDIVEFFNN